MSDEDHPKRRIPAHPRDIERAQTIYQRLSDLRASTAETKQLTSGRSADELRIDSERAEAERTEKFRNHFERLAILTLYITWLAMMIIALLWVYHLIAPPAWWRLPDQQVSNLHAIVTGGFIAGLASGHMKRRLN